METALTDDITDETDSKEKTQRVMIILARIMSVLLGFAGLGLIIIGIMFIVLNTAKSQYNSLKNRICSHTVRNKFTATDIEKILASPRGEFAVSHQGEISVIDRKGNMISTYDVNLKLFFISDRNIYGMKELKGNKNFYSLRLSGDNSRAEDLPDKYTYTMITAGNEPEEFLIVGTKDNNAKISCIVEYVDNKFIVHEIGEFEVKSIVYVNAGLYYLIGNKYEGDIKKASIYKYYTDGMSGGPMTSIANKEITEGLGSLPIIFAWTVVKDKTEFYSYNIKDCSTKEASLNFIVTNAQCQPSGEGSIACLYIKNDIPTLVKLDKDLSDAKTRAYGQNEVPISFSRTQSYTNVLLTEKESGIFRTYTRHEISDSFEDILNDEISKSDLEIDFFGPSDHNELGVISHRISDSTTYYVTKFAEKTNFNKIEDICFKL